jgi:hypothetical protein
MLVEPRAGNPDTWAENVGRSPTIAFTASMTSLRDSTPNPCGTHFEFPRVYRIDYNQVLGLLANQDATFFNGW